MDFPFRARSCHKQRTNQQTSLKLSANNSDRQYNIRSREFIITGGTFMMALDEQMQVKEWEIFTNPTQWVDYAFPHIEVPASTMRIRAEFDINTIARRT